MALKRQTLSLCLATLSLMLAPPLAAQEVTVLEGIVIESAGLEPAEAGKLGSAYTVITGKELEERQIRHAGDALRAVPGLSVSQSGGRGSFTQLRVRGAEANQVAVFIDGVEVNSLDSGEFDFATLLTADIERIEVLRGPQSGVYGGNALAGVINIITRKGKGPARVSASAETGSFNTRELTANASGGSERGYFSASGVTRKTDGYNIARGSGEDDGSEQTALFARGGLALTDNFRIDAIGRRQDNRTDIDQDVNFDGLLDDARDEVNIREQTFGRITATLDLFDKALTQKIFAEYFEDDFASLSATFGNGFNESSRRKYGYQATYGFATPSFLGARHGLTGFIEHKDEAFQTSSSPGNTFTREQTGVVGEYRGEFLDSLFVTANIRQDYNDAFEDALTYRATAAYLLKGTGTRLHASYGKGITNPTFFEQFGVFGGFVGNPGLQPEESIGWDAGIEQTFFGGRAVLDVTYFRADLKDEIVFQTLTSFPDPFTFTYVNAEGESERQGIEVQLTLKPVDGLTITGGYTYTDSTGPNGAREIRRPEHAASLNAAYTFADGRALLNLGLIYNGEMDDIVFSFPQARVALDDYLLVNVSGSYRLDDNITLFARAENLLDEDYEEVFGFSAAPVGAYAGVKVTFSEAAPLEAGLK